jgi:hypothetical protein
MALLTRRVKEAKEPLMDLFKEDRVKAGRHLLE